MLKQTLNGVSVHIKYLAMKMVKLVPNKKTGAMYVPTTSGNWYRVQVTQEASSFSNGFERTQKLTGFAYLPNEERAKAFVAAAAINGNEIEGSVVYVDQLTPINGESAEYGKQYPYPFRFNGKELTVEERMAIQAKAVDARLPLMQSGQAIYRRKFFTPDTEAKSIVLSPDNQDDINAFIATVLETRNAPDPAKIARLAELRAIKAGTRTADQKKELAALIEELE